MKSFALAMLSVATLPLALPAPAVAQKANWANRVSLSSEGGHVLGNRKAATRIVEYMSYTCGHCADFEQQAAGPLKAGPIADGSTSFEVRNLVLNPVDMTAAMLARCGGASKFFGNHRALLDTQSDWIARFAKLTPEQQRELSAGTPTEKMQAVARLAGFYPIMQRRGVSKAQANACLADKAAQDAVLGMTRYARDTLKLPGTPSFTINGKVLDGVHGWPGLKGRLDR